MRQKILGIMLWTCVCISIRAQRHEIISTRIASLQVTSGDNWTELPIMMIGQQTPVNISFDELSHDYKRFSYNIEHCESDWSVSENIFESDYCEGFARGNLIDDFRQSLNTNQLYTHYNLQIPNDRCRLKLSGNYRVTVYDEEDRNAPVFIAYFMVVDPLMTVGLNVTANTDLGINRCFQQVEMTLRYAGVNVTDPSSQIKTVVMQNGRWDNAVVNVKPQYVNSQGMAWQHCHELIFDGGNEYRKFEMLDLNHTTMGLERILWDGHMYHATIWPDEPRPNYVYDKDADGAFRIRNSDQQDNDVTTDYAMVHFRLVSPHVQGNIYIHGVWTNHRFQPQYKMKWNEEEQVYEASVLLKQGYYNYQYLWQQYNGTIVPVPSEGNFYQTQNTYQALIYFRGIGERTDRLVGYGRMSTE